MHKRLKLQHRRHTGKRLAHHHTSYPGMAAVLLACGLAMVMIQRAGAASYIVTARVPVEIPTTAAEITAPPTALTFQDADVTVSGTCPIINPAIIVSLWENIYMTGSQVCQPDGTFSIPITLFRGLNKIVPKVTTIQDDPGPDGLEWTATYIPPVQPQQPQTGGTDNGGTGGQTTVPALIISDAFVQSVVGNETVIMITITPTEKPYELTMDWGDGVVESSVYSVAGRYELRHVYKSAGNYQVKLTLKDGNGRISRFSLAVVSTGKSPLKLISSAKPLPQLTGGTDYFWVGIAWAAYLAGLAIVTGLWLAQRYGHERSRFGHDFAFAKPMPMVPAGRKKTHQKSKRR